MIIEIEHGDYSSFNTINQEQLDHIEKTFTKYENYGDLHEYLCQNCEPEMISSTNQIEIYFGLPTDVDKEEWEEIMTCLTGGRWKPEVQA